MNKNELLSRLGTDDTYERVVQLADFLIKSDHPLIAAFLNDQTTHCKLIVHVQDSRIIRAEIDGTVIQK